MVKRAVVAIGALGAVGVLALSSAILTSSVNVWGFLRSDYRDEAYAVIDEGGVLRGQDVVPVYVVDEHNEAAFYFPRLRRRQRAVILHIDKHSDLFPPILRANYVAASGGGVGRDGDPLLPLYSSKSTYILKKMAENAPSSKVDYIWIYDDGSDSECKSLCAAKPAFTSCSLCWIRDSEHASGEILTNQWKVYPHRADNKVEPSDGVPSFCSQVEIDGAHVEIFGPFQYLNVKQRCLKERSAHSYRTFWSSISQASSSSSRAIKNVVETLADDDYFILDIDEDFFVEESDMPLYNYDAHPKNDGTTQLCKALTSFSPCIFEIGIDPLQIANFFLDSSVEPSLGYAHFFEDRLRDNILPDSSSCEQWHSHLTSLLRSLTDKEKAMLRSMQRGEGLAKLCFVDTSSKSHAERMVSKVSEVRAFLEQLERKPDVITIARSLGEDTPLKLWPVLESAILKALKIVYTDDKIKVFYGKGLIKAS